MLARIANPYAPKLDCIDIAHGRDGRVLVLSMRKVADLVGYTAMYEFEDIVAVFRDQPCELIQPNYNINLGVQLRVNGYTVDNLDEIKGLHKHFHLISFFIVKAQVVPESTSIGSQDDTITFPSRGVVGEDGDDK